MLPSLQQNASATSDSDPFRGYTWPVGRPCERFMSALAGRPRITRGWDGWLDLPRGGSHLPFFASLPGARRLGSRTAFAAMLASRPVYPR
jgi:hypothetical protein